MIERIISALLPILVTLSFGYLAGRLKNFSTKDSVVLVHFAMLYALPITLFTGILTLSPKTILSQGSLTLALTLGMLIPFFLVYVLSRYVFKRNPSVAILQSIAIASPAVPFMGVPILDYLFGNLGNIPITEGAILLNLIILPITIFVLNTQKASTGEESSGKGIILKEFINSIKQPVVWAPFLALALVLLGIHLPKEVNTSLDLLGKTTGGVALFAVGLSLFTYKISLSWSVVISVLSRNLVIPALALLIFPFLGMVGASLNIAVVTLSIPSATICVILAVEYGIAQKEMASTVLFSTLLSILSMGLFLYLVG